MTLPERIEEIITKLDINVLTFSKGLGVTRATIDNYIKDKKSLKKKTKPNFNVILKMYEVYNINPLYVLGISNDMFLLDIEKNNHEAIVDFVISNDAVLSTFEKYRDFLDSRTLELKEAKLKKEFLDTLEDFKTKFMKD